MSAVDLEIKAVLSALAEPGYREFQCRLMPNVPPERVLGVRIPALRRYARSIGGTEVASYFLQTLPHDSYDADNLHALLIAEMKDYDAAVAALDAFLPYVDNWATCDICRPAVLGREKERLRVQIDRWIEDPHPYTVRFGMEQLMLHFLGDHFSPSDLVQVAACAGKWSAEYYVVMMAAWYFATALAVQQREVLPWLIGDRLFTDLRRKALRKALESRRIPPELKQKLREILKSI